MMARLILAAQLTFVAFACSPGPAEKAATETEAHDDHGEAAQVPMTEEEQATWDVTAAFIAGVFTLASSDGLEGSVFFKNFRENYDWVKNSFLPHLRDDPKHNWWECDAYCIKTARLLAKGDKEKERELREALSRYRVHENK
jgi:hypothetical protein